MPRHKTAEALTLCPLRLMVCVTFRQGRPARNTTRGLAIIVDGTVAATRPKSGLAMKAATAPLLSLPALPLPPPPAPFPPPAPALPPAPAPAPALPAPPPVPPPAPPVPTAAATSTAARPTRAATGTTASTASAPAMAARSTAIVATAAASARASSPATLGESQIRADDFHAWRQCRKQDKGGSRGQHSAKD